MSIGAGYWYLVKSSTKLILFDSNLSTETFDYPKVDYPLVSFTVIPPGIIMLPLEGGIYMPGINDWYMQPGEEPILSTTLSPDGSIYYDKIFENTSHILRAYKENGNTTITVTDTFARGFYTISATASQTYYVSGFNEGGSFVWQRQGEQARVLFESRSPITAFCAINSDAFLICHEKTLALFVKGKEPEVIDTLIESAEGIAVDETGRIYVSTKSGIYRQDLNEATPIAGGVHGVLQYLSGKLYVLWQDQSKVVVISGFEVNEVLKESEPVQYADSIAEVQEMPDVNSTIETESAYTAPVSNWQPVKQPAKEETYTTSSKKAEVKEVSKPKVGRDCISFSNISISSKKRRYEDEYPKGHDFYDAWLKDYFASWTVTMDIENTCSSNIYIDEFYFENKYPCSKDYFSRVATLDPIENSWLADAAEKYSDIKIAGYAAILSPKEVKKAQFKYRVRDIDGDCTFDFSGFSAIIKTCDNCK